MELHYLRYQISKKFIIVFFSIKNMRMEKLEINVSVVTSYISKIDKNCFHKIT